MKTSNDHKEPLPNDPKSIILIKLDKDSDLIKKKSGIFDTAHKLDTSQIKEFKKSDVIGILYPGEGDEEGEDEPEASLFFPLSFL